MARQRLFCAEFLDPGTGTGRSLSECVAAWELSVPMLKGGCGDTNKDACLHFLYIV